ncbi:TRAP transporter substrate-binding protein [Acidaminobacter hydrogenoformans]|uniref:Tripartite ATP-independent transporter solute receptor, DctP family n=1 Tax=Acidaminobacter hydrogenoformans DSM 2784 TaxID=1120920 RepID=A0A1G5RYX8_9FIRM|nr:DctP family TRAP transporter solute-binding subunit [Acidaminobacter hydrogenoformans]SCZ79334.1 tripartite ATP-independent transporter solute receptor, DctP family [Acidaminobacter hydrogenoformans DSM 2784]
MKKLVSILLVLAMVFSLAACGGGTTEPAAPAEQPSGETPAAEMESYSWSVGIDSPEDTVTFIYAKAFSDKLAELSDGKITLQVFPNGQLGSDREVAESVQLGDVQFVIQTTAPMVNFVPELAVFDMANVFPNAEVARKVLDGPFISQLDEAYAKAGFKLLGFADQGFRTMTTNKKVESFADFKGQKIRTMENPNHLGYWQALGANPTPMAFSEVYIGLQQGTIDAQENPYEVIVSAKLFEQQKYVINTNHMFHAIQLVTNKALYEGLPADVQAIIDQAVDEASVFAREQADARVADRVKIITDSGAEIVEVSDALRAEMEAAAATVYPSIAEKIGQDLVDGILKAAEEAK